MKRTACIKFILIMGIILTFNSLKAFAEEPEETRPTATLDLGAFSKYIWRGYELSDESVAIQPSITIGYKGFSMNLWGNLDTHFDDGDSGTDDDVDFNETDVTGAYSTRIGNLDLGVGYIYYALSASDTEEIYASICASALPLSPTLAVYRDIRQFPGWYLNLGLGHAFIFDNGMALKLAAKAGYTYSDDDAFTAVGSTEKYRAFHDGQVSASLTIPVEKDLSVTPVIAYAFPLESGADDLLTAASFSDRSDFLYGGVTLSLAF